MPRIAHISDLHLQSRAHQRQKQVDLIFRAIDKAKPDLVIISGDITDDGWKSFDELVWGKSLLDSKLNHEWHAIPGNHDVGNFATPSDDVKHNELLQYTHWWGDAFEERNLDDFEWVDGPWKILGLNSMLFGSGSEEELTQWRRRIKSHEESSWEGTHLALFLHTPLFTQSPTEPDDAQASYWLGPKAARIDCWDRLSQTNLRMVGSGHVHQTRLTEVDGVKIAWAPPASGTWVHAPGLPNPPMPEKTGFFLHTLHDDGRVDSELIECAPMLKLYEHRP